MLSIKNLSHTYTNGIQALDNINLEIGPGLFGLLGANGAGKSTMLQIISTLLEPASGQVSMAGMDVVHNRNEVRKLFGYLPQEFGMWGNQKVSDILDILASLSGMHDRELRRKRINSVLDSVGLGDVSRRKVKKLSGGMLRRLGLAQALIHEPKILILDEPTVGMDPEERIRFRQLMTDLSKDRVIILSTHIIADLGASCSNLALIHGGKLEFIGTPAELISRAKGKVFEMRITTELLQHLELKESFEVVSQFTREGMTLIRGVDAEGLPKESARSLTDISLEEAYLAHVLGKGRKISLQTPEESGMGKFIK